MINKKIKDISLGELVRLCNSYAWCSWCPLDKGHRCPFKNPRWTFKEHLNDEISFTVSDKDKV